MNDVCKLSIRLLIVIRLFHIDEKVRKTVEKNRNFW